MSRGRMNDNVESVRYTADKLQGLADDYHHLYDQLYLEAEVLQGSDWKDVAGNEFHARLESYKPDFEALYDVLKEIKGTLDSLADTLSMGIPSDVMSKLFCKRMRG